MNKDGTASQQTGRGRTWRDAALWGLTRLSVLLLSATFLFSGFTKAIDPMGMCIKLNAYCHALGLHLADNALPLQFATVALAMLETALGIFLLLGIRRKLTTISALGFMLCMTALTTYLYIYAPVADCGCFGDVVVLTHGQTLAKNVVLLCAATFLAFRPQGILRLISERNQWLTSTWSVLYVMGVALYSFHYLPVVEFTPYRVGANVRAALTDPTSAESHTELATFYVADEAGNVLTDSLVADSGMTLLLTLPDEASADDGCNDRINDLADYCHDRGIPLYGLIAEEEGDRIENWVDRTGATYPFLMGESAQIKALVRSNPGLLLLHDGRIAAKWSNNQLPDVSAETAQPAQWVQPAGARRGLVRLLLAFVVPLSLIILADRLWVGSKLYKRRQIRKRINKQMDDDTNKTP